MSKNKKILILGASGEIAQNFIYNFFNKKNLIFFNLKLNKTLKKKYKKNYFSKFSKKFIQNINKSNIIINFIGEIYLTNRMMSKNFILINIVIKLLLTIIFN